MLVIRKAEVGDAAVLAEILVRSFCGAFSEFISAETLKQCANPDNCTAMLREVCQSNSMHSYLALRDGVSCGELFWQEGEEAELIALHSLPEVWGTGVGHELLERALADMSAAGIKRVALWAFRENLRARTFYEKHGLHWNGEERSSEHDGAVEMRYEKELSA